MQNSWANNFQPPVGNQTEPKGQIGSHVTISYIVRSIQNQLNDYSMGQYKRLLQLTIDAVREMRLYNQVALQVAYLYINDAGIIPFPSDYIDYTKIGIPVHGQFITLSVNNKMILNRAQVCGEDIRHMYENNGFAINSLADGYYFAPHFNGLNYVGGLYGAGGGFNRAYFRVDKTARQIQFDGIIPQVCDGRMVVIEYSSTGISAGTVISPECIDPLRKYVHQYRVEYDSRVSLSEKQRREDHVTIANRKLRAFNNKFTMSEYMDTLYIARKQSPKPD